ncbi:MAG: glycosyltransferase family 4 protein [Candidatus Kaelpia imicola]|nr:glycosyltransferase family 4 protein [Candidatus Kaelpia imicola]
MKILMLHPHDIFHLSEPWTIRIKSIAKEFKREGHEVRIAYFPLNHKSLRNSLFNYSGIDIITLDRRRGLGVFFKNIKRLIKEVEWADIVHFQKCFHYCSIPAVIAAWIKNKPLHYDWDDWETKIYFYGKPASPVIGLYIWMLERALPKFVDSISLSSRRLAQLATDNYGISKKRITAAPVGADSDEFKPENRGEEIRREYRINGPIVLYLGQLHGAQYAELLIHAAKIVIQWHPTTMFFIVGGGYRLEELKKTAREFGLSDRIIFTGSLPHSQMRRYTAAADVCVGCFARNDITMCKSPLKLAEYLASGKAIVASNVGEVRNMVGGVGVLVEPGNHIILAGGISELLSRPDLRAKMGVLARRRALERYNWSWSAENIMSIYRRVLKGYELKRL